MCCIKSRHIKESGLGAVLCARVECEFLLAKLFLCSFRECVNYHVNSKSPDTFIKRSQNIKSLHKFL